MTTVREQQVSDAVERLGSATRAAAELGISRVTVEVTLAHYHQKACVPRAEEMEARIAELEAECDRLRAAPQRADRLRSAPQRVVFIDHRRVIDGGCTKRQQMRKARTA